METVANESDMIPDPAARKGRRAMRQAVTGQCDLLDEASSLDVVRGGEGHPRELAPQVRPEV